MPNDTAMKFWSLHLPRPLDATAVLNFLTRLAAERDAPRVALEIRADQDGTRHLLGARPTDIHGLRQMITDLMPGSLLVSLKGGQRNPRPLMDVAARLRIRPTSLPLRTDTAEATTRALLSAFATALKAGEALTMQLIVGARRAPRTLPANAVEPGSTLVQALTRGDRPASSDTRKQLKERLSWPGFAATIRLGATSPDPARRRRFIMSLLGAIATTQSPGVHIDLARQATGDIDDVRLPWRWPLHLSAPEMVGLLGWPISDGELPGLPPLHPKALRAADSVHTGPRVFAVSAAPGDDRQIGIAAKDQMFHGAAYGPSGSGKTNALLHLICHDIEAGRPVAVLDPKRQLIDDVLSRIPKHRMNDVVVLDASDAVPTGFNPLDVTGRDPDVVVDGILAVFEAVFKDGWGPRSSDIISACLRTLARTATPTRPAILLDLPRILTDAKYRLGLVGRVRGDVALAGFWAWYESQSAAAQAAVIAAPQNKLRQFLLRPALMKMLGQTESKFRLRDIFRGNKIVLVPLNDGLIGPGTASLLGSLIIADLWQATQERASEPDVASKPGMIYIDEAPRFLHLSVGLDDALAVSRSLAVGWFLAAQFRSQFPPALRSAADINARSKLVFATEYEDARDFAKLTRDLTSESFLALPKYHAYCNLVADGHPSGWALVKTLPPPEKTSDPEVVRARARANYAPKPDVVPPNHDPGQPGDERPDAPEVKVPLPLEDEPIGRKRRRS